jgi:hypothetical protein
MTIKQVKIVEVLTLSVKMLLVFGVCHQNDAVFVD